MIDLVAYVATALILAAYVRGGRLFDRANAWLWPFVAASSFEHHAYPSLIITLSFGAIGITHLWRHRGRA